ncbi:zinc finger CCCH domain-containing protein 48 [Tanacetum coccineum]
MSSDGFMVGSFPYVRKLPKVSTSKSYNKESIVPVIYLCQLPAFESIVVSVIDAKKELLVSVRKDPDNEHIDLVSNRLATLLRGVISWCIRTFLRARVIGLMPMIDQQLYSHLTVLIELLPISGIPKGSPELFDRMTTSLRLSWLEPPYKMVLSVCVRDDEDGVFLGENRHVAPYVYTLLNAPGDDDNLPFTMRSSSTPVSWLGSHTESVIAAMLGVVSGIALPVRPDKLYTGSKDETIRVWDFQDSEARVTNMRRGKFIPEEDKLIINLHMLLAKESIPDSMRKKNAFLPEQLCCGIETLKVPGAYSNGVINNKAALERQHINVVEADIRHNLVQSTGPDDLFSLNNGHLTTSFLDSLPTATRENVQKAM